MSVTLLVDVTPRSAGYSGVARWVDGFVSYLDSKGIAYQETSAPLWAGSTRGLLRLLVRIRVLRDLLYYSVGLRLLSARYERVVILDNIGRLILPLPAGAHPFYLIHDFIPFELSARWVRQSVGWGAAFAWMLTRRFYGWRLKRILFAPGARFGYISRATEQAAYTALGPRAERGEWIGPMALSDAVRDEGSVDPRVAALVEGQRYILALGTGDPKKGIESLLAAWARARVAGELKLVLFGASWKRKGHRWIESAIHELGVSNVVQLGQVSEATLRCLYRYAAAFVFPSRFEGLGLPPAEYCLEGSGELILRDIPALREIYGDVARFFSSDDDLLRLLQDVAGARNEAPVSADFRRQTLQARLDPSIAFDRLCAAVMSQRP